MIRQLVAQSGLFSGIALQKVTGGRTQMCIDRAFRLPARYALRQKAELESPRSSTREGSGGVPVTVLVLRGYEGLGWEREEGLYAAVQDICM